MKKALAIGLSGIILGAAAVASQDVSVRQEVHKAADGRYKQYLKDEFKKGVQIDVYEVDGVPGYEVIEEEVRKNGDVYIRSAGSGPEEWRYHDWKRVYQASTTP